MVDTDSAKALLLVLSVGAIGKKSVEDTRPAEFGGDSGWLSENMRGLWLVICGD